MTLDLRPKHIRKNLFASWRNPQKFVKICAWKSSANSKNIQLCWKLESANFDKVLRIFPTRKQIFAYKFGTHIMRHNCPFKPQKNHKRQNFAAATSMKMFQTRGTFQRKVRSDPKFSNKRFLKFSNFDDRCAIPSKLRLKLKIFSGSRIVASPNLLKFSWELNFLVPFEKFPIFWESW